jgi:hypothetical protein
MTNTKPDIDDIWFTQHCQERLRSRYPRAGIRGAQSIYEEGLALSAEQAHTLMIRHPASMEGRQIKYVIDAGLTGVFVLVAKYGELEGMLPYSAVTFKRLTVDQSQLASQILGVEPRQPRVSRSHRGHEQHAA